MLRYPIVPRQPVLLRLRALVMTLALLLAVSACRSSGTMTPRPQPLATPTPTPSPSPTPTPHPTRTPAPTATTLPTVDPAVPLPVAMTLDEARAEVWSWLDPAHAPRIVSVDYVAGAAVAPDEFISGERFVFDYFGGMQDVRLLAENRMPPTVVRVVAECAPLDAPLLTQMVDFRGGGPGYDTPRRLVVLFDATTGARLGAMAADGHKNVIVDSALAAPTVAITYRATRIPPTATVERLSPIPTPMPTWTQVIVPTPVGPTVRADSVPPALREALTDYPLLPGNAWTWESTSFEGGVKWSRSRMTETVTGAWQIDDVRVAVRTRVERRLEFGSTYPNANFSSKSDEWRTVTSAGAVYGYPVASGMAAGDHPFITITDREVRRLRLPLEALAFPHADFYWSWPEAITTTRIAVTTPAGRFEDCGAFEVIGGNSWASVRAICPGIGYVETDSWSQYGTTVTRLVAYRVVLPR